MSTVETLNPFSEEEEMFRQTVRSFYAKELEPRVKDFEKSGVDREFWRNAG
jgi:alkylation response protein AidB-like acyl-CoA dehydrogenase